jgi:hypothetical protein
MYSIKVAVDANGRQYAAGMGIGVQNTPSGMQSQVLFVADRFAVMSQAGGAVNLPSSFRTGRRLSVTPSFRMALSPMPRSEMSFSRIITVRVQQAGPSTRMVLLNSTMSRFVEGFTPRMGSLDSPTQREESRSITTVSLSICRTVGALFWESFDGQGTLYRFE